MPIPKPKSGETERDYIPRCMSALDGEDKPQDQKLAICYTNYREVKKVELISVGYRVLKSILTRIVSKK